MKITALSYKGTTRESQQDAVLVNGHLITDGELVLEDQKEISCFVADGVAGSSDGAFASKFILEKINDIRFKDWPDGVGKLREVNSQLIKENNDKGGSAASTLCGITKIKEEWLIFQAGDCEIYLLRDEFIIPIAAVHNESIENVKKKNPGVSVETLHQIAANTITSFFGSTVSKLTFDLDWRRRLALPKIQGIQATDSVLICSDGLFKSIGKIELQNFITQFPDRMEFAKEVRKLSEKNGAPDNVSLVLMEF